MLDILYPCQDTDIPPSVQDGFAYLTFFWEPFWKCILSKTAGPGEYFPRLVERKSRSNTGGTWAKAKQFWYQTLDDIHRFSSLGLLLQPSVATLRWNCAMFFWLPENVVSSDFHLEDIDTLHSYFQPKTSGRSEGRPTTPGSSGRGSMVGTPRAVFTDSVARMGVGDGGAPGVGEMDGWDGWGWKQIIWMKLLEIEICFWLKLLDWKFSESEANRVFVSCSPRFLVI